MSVFFFDSVSLLYAFVSWEWVWEFAAGGEWRWKTGLWEGLNRVALRGFGLLNDDMLYSWELNSGRTWR